jgi:thioredoxin 1
MTKTVHVNDQTFDGDVLTSERPVLADFWAEWCGPCKAIAPALEELAREYDGRATIVKVNVDENPTLAARFGIRSIPTLLLFKDGKVVDQLIGAMPKAEIKRRLDAVA